MPCRMVTRRLPICQCRKHSIPGPFENRSASVPQILALRSGAVIDGDASPVVLRSERYFKGRGFLRVRAHVEIEHQTVRWFPCQDFAKFGFAAIAGTLPKAPRLLEKQFALRIFRQPVSLRPPLGDTAGKEVE